MKKILLIGCMLVILISTIAFGGEFVTVTISTSTPTALLNVTGSVTYVKLVNTQDYNVDLCTAAGAAYNGTYTFTLHSTSTAISSNLPNSLEIRDLKDCKIYGIAESGAGASGAKVEVIYFKE